MIVNPIQPQHPSFGLKTQRAVRYHSFTKKSITDTAYLQNGKSLRIIKYFDYDKLTQKLYYLKDEAGKWVKSKLKTYKGNSINQVLQSNRLDSLNS